MKKKKSVALTRNQTQAPTWQVRILPLNHQFCQWFVIAYIVFILSTLLFCLARILWYAYEILMFRSLLQWTESYLWPSYVVSIILKRCGLSRGGRFMLMNTSSMRCRLLANHLRARLTCLYCTTIIPLIHGWSKVKQAPGQPYFASVSSVTGMAYWAEFWFNIHCHKVQLMFWNDQHRMLWTV